MAYISRKISIDRPADEVWKVVSRFGSIQEFSPGVPKSYLTSDQETGIGATRHCDLSISGSSIEERVTDWEENKLYLVDIYAGKKIPPFSHASGGFELTEDGGKTTVEFRLSYALKMGILGKLMDALMVKRQFAKTAEGVVAGLKYYCETGVQVGAETELDFAQVR